MLLCNNIYFSRGNKLILNNVCFSLSPKKIIHLTGNNGVGKTTLLKVICNILDPQKGDIYWNGKNIKKNFYKFYNKITYIMDTHTANNNLTVDENIFFWCKFFSSKINISELNSILNVLGLDKYKNTQVKFLSYGEIKKLELLRLMIEQRKLWIIDEPYIGLDQASVELINQTIINHIELNGMVILTSHIQPLIRNIETLNLDHNE